MFFFNFSNWELPHHPSISIHFIWVIFLIIQETRLQLSLFFFFFFNPWINLQQSLQLFFVNTLWNAASFHGSQPEGSLPQCGSLKWSPRRCPFLQPSLPVQAVLPTISLISFTQTLIYKVSTTAIKRSLVLYNSSKTIYNLV